MIQFLCNKFARFSEFISDMNSGHWGDPDDFSKSTFRGQDQPGSYLY